MQWGFANLDPFIHFHHLSETDWIYFETRVMTGVRRLRQRPDSGMAPVEDLLATGISQVAFLPRREGWSSEKKGRYRTPFDQ